MAQNNVSKKRNLGAKIKMLAKEGMSYRQIEAKLGCSKSTIAYHLNPEVKKDVRVRQQVRKAKLVTYNRIGKGV